MVKEDENAIRKVIDNYITGTFKADIVSLQACFHPKAVMNGYLGDDLLLGGPEPFFRI